MRDIYYQSVGNPLQLDRLPETRPSIEMLPPAPPTAKTLSLIMSNCAVAIVAGLTALVLYNDPGVTWLEPYDLLFAVPVFLAGLTVAVYTGQVRWLLHPLFLIAAVLLFVSHRTPWPLQVLVLAGGSALWVYCLGLHWTTVCTASPTDRSTAYRLRTQWKPQLQLLCALAAVLTGTVLWFDAPVLKCAVAALPLAALAIGSPDGLQTPHWKVILQAAVSWLTYHARPYPGLLQSPVGPARHRRALLISLAIITAATLIRWPGSPAAHVTQWAHHRQQAITAQLDARNAGLFQRVRHIALPWAAAIGSISALPVFLVWTMGLSLTMPLLLEAAAHRDRSQSDTANIQNVLTDIRRSPDLVERHSIYRGRVVADGSPVLLPRDMYGEHAHILGDAGSGKTALGLCPTIEQLALSGDCSIIVVDLKADTHEMLATLYAVTETVRRTRGVNMPLKVFSNQPDRATFGFNPMRQPNWSKFDLQARTDILCGANGLTYGTDYGEGYYSSANAAVLYHTMKTFPHVDNFRELAQCIGHVLMSSNRRELHPEIRRAGVHVHEVVKRLGACKPLNVTDTTEYPPEVVAQEINLADVFRVPQLIYCHLSATLSPSGAPEIARLLTYMLLATATKTERRHPVYLVIDEFQRMVAANLEYMLQLARSMGVGLILANQAMEDLKRSKTNLIPAIEANCRIREWYSVSSSDDQERLMRSSGLTVDLANSRSVTVDREGRRSVTHSQTEQVVNRITISDIALTNDHPFRSFLRISRGAGYAQYGGLPVIVQSDYHISKEEYERRKAFPWPEEPGSFIPGIDNDDDEGAGVIQSPGPKNPDWTGEIIGKSPEPLGDVDKQAIGQMFENFQQKLNPPKKPSED